MRGQLPERAWAYRVVAGETLEEPFAPRAPAGGEVVIEVAGSALGVEPGAEVAGRVVAAGEAAAEWLGRRVVAPRLLPCGECDRCRRGRVVACRSRAVRGQVATSETVPARFLLSLEPPLWPEGAQLPWMAALADAAAAPYAALVRAQVAPGETVLVLGGGVRGRVAALLAEGLGAAAVVLDGDPDRRGEAGRLGIKAAWDDDAAPAELIERLTAFARERGLGMFEMKVVETTGSASGRRRALELAAPIGATVALLGDGDGLPARAPLGELASSEAQVVGAGACHPDLLPELAALVVRGALPLGELCAVLPFRELARALADRRAGRLLRLPVLAAAPASDRG